MFYNIQHVVIFSAINYVDYVGIPRRYITKTNLAFVNSIAPGKSAIEKTESGFILLLKGEKSN